MLLLFYFNELHQRIKNILFVKKTSNYRLFVNQSVEKHYRDGFHLLHFSFYKELYMILSSLLILSDDYLLIFI